MHKIRIDLFVITSRRISDEGEASFEDNHSRATFDYWHGMSLSHSFNQLTYFFKTNREVLDLGQAEGRKIF